MSEKGFIASTIRKCSEHENCKVVATDIGYKHSSQLANTKRKTRFEEGYIEISKIFFDFWDVGQMEVKIPFSQINETIDRIIEVGKN